MRVGVVIGSNREGRFGPVVTDRLPARIRERDDFAPEVVDVAALRLPTALSYSPSPSVAAELAKVTPALARGPGTSTSVQRTGERATRNPTSSTRKVGWLRRRAEARQLQCSSNQPPPRSTR